jgi:hypothetical protein
VCVPRSEARWTDAVARGRAREYLSRVDERWAAWLTVLLTCSCIESRRFEGDGASGADSQSPNAGQGGASAGHSGAGGDAGPQAGDAGQSATCFPGRDGMVADGCVRGSSVAAGDDFSCGLLAVGGIYCWGEDADGQVTGAPQAGNFVSIAAGRRHACALRADQTLQCWGNDSQQQAPADATSEYYGRFKSVACGDDFTCGVHVDGSPLCFGSSAYGKINPPFGEYLMIASGANAACGVRSDNRVVCWGDDSAGIVSLVKGGVFKTVAVGPEHACAIDVDRQMFCWGEGAGGGQGVGATRTDVRPGSYLAVSAGSIHTAAITVGDRFTCFGDESAAPQCSSLSSPENFGAWYQVAAGRRHTCILGEPKDSSAPNGTIECFGLGGSLAQDKVFKSGR